MLQVHFEIGAFCCQDRNYFLSLRFNSFFGYCFIQDLNQPRTTCILQDVTPGTYTLEVHKRSNGLNLFLENVCVFIQVSWHLL